MNYSEQVNTIESELEETKRVMSELQEIIEKSFDGILVTDGEGNVLLVNESYVRNTDIKKEEVVGHNVKELINPIWMKNSVALLAIEQGQAVSLHHTTKHGRNIIVTGTPIIKNGVVKKVIVNTRDISEIYALREELDKAKEMEKLYHESLKNNECDTVHNEMPFIVKNAKMQNIFKLVKKISSFDTTVLITGESGVGKERIAAYLHKQNVLRSHNPFITVNCGAIPENLLEAQLFGYEEGAFTGASKGGKKGIFEAADGGTLFLDEIGEMSLNLQVKLLRALENRTITRVGGTEEISVDLRIVAATNQNLKDMIEDKTFREDLYYRLNVISIDIPPLRERIDEVALLSLNFLNQFNIQYGQKKKLTYEVIKELELHDWPGNIRQLKNVIENMVVVSTNDELLLSDLPWFHEDKHYPQNDILKKRSLPKLMANYEKKILEEAKKEFHTSRKIAEYLDMEQSTIVRKLNKYGL